MNKQDISHILAQYLLFHYLYSDKIAKFYCIAFKWPVFRKKQYHWSKTKGNILYRRQKKSLKVTLIILH